MAYSVKLTPRAKKDLDQFYTWAAREAPFRGPIWFDRLEQAILSLEQMPHRYPVMPALSTIRRTVRRLLFTIDGETVTILHVQHGARRDLRRL